MDQINFESLQRQFAQIGADLQVEVREPPTTMVQVDKNGKELPHSKRWRQASRASHGIPFTADIRGSGKNEHYIFRVDPELVQSIQVVDLDKDGRHLLLNVQTLPTTEGAKTPAPQKLLLGHDEYHWFVAPVPRSSINIHTAKEALKPAPVQEAQRKTKVKAKHLHKRRQEAFVRQGEWFFLPAPDLVVDPKLILRKEPIRRGLGKPHVCEELYRTGGKTVMVSSNRPNGISMDAYNRLSQEERRKGGMWRQMVQNPTAYARGRVTHSDHSTIHLKVWHRIQVNTEGPASVAGVIMNWLD
jgi:hypothetical protein